MTYFHGGVPNLRPGDTVWSAAKLNLTFSYRNATVLRQPRYDRNFVYLTSHLGTARAYAARYLARGGKRRPGTVYEVAPAEPLRADPDYETVGSNVFVMTSHARVVSVVETGVVLSAREQNEASWPYLFWASASEPRYDRDGTMRASAEMAANAVTDDYLALLPKWLEVDAIGRGGGLIVTDGDGFVDAPPAVVLDTFAHLGLDSSPQHQVIAQVSPFGFVELVCRCGEPMISVLVGALHQVGEPELRLIAKYNFTPEDMWPLIFEFAKRSPQRWEWLAPILRAVGPRPPLEALFCRPNKFRIGA